MTLKGNLNRLTTIDFSYLSYIAAQWTQDKPTQWIKLSVNRVINDEDSLVLTGEAKIFADSDPNTQDNGYITSRLDFVRAF
jgi:hypothetical protein